MSSVPPTATGAVLLVLLPLPPSAGAPNEVWASLLHLRQHLGPAVRVLAIDEASHPAVVRSFGLPELPACVLMRQGVELWRQQGLPSAKYLLASVLAAIQPVLAAS